MKNRIDRKKMRTERRGRHAANGLGTIALKTVASKYDVPALLSVRHFSMMDWPLL